MSTSSEEAADRAQAARERTAELEERLRRLRGGEAVTQEDVAQAVQAAQRQDRRSGDAYRHAAAAHSEAALQHRAASDLLEAAGHPERAAEHRRRAGVDDDAADVDNASAGEQG